MHCRLVTGHTIEEVIEWRARRKLQLTDAVLERKSASEGWLVVADVLQPIYCNQLRRDSSRGAVVVARRNRLRCARVRVNHVCQEVYL